MGPGILWALILVSGLTSNQILYEYPSLIHRAVSALVIQDSLLALVVISSTPLCVLASLFTDHGAGQFYIRPGANNSCPGGSHGIISVVSSVPSVGKHLSLRNTRRMGMRGLAERLIVSRTGMRVRQWERTLSRSVTPSIASRSLIPDIVTPPWLRQTSTSTRRQRRQ